MKKILIPVLFLFILFSCRTTKIAKEVQTVPQTVVSEATAQTPVPSVNFSDPSTFVLGYFDVSKLRNEPYSVWFTKGFIEYTYNEAVVQKLREINTDNLKIKIVMGTWCPDSRREVPRFMKVLDGWDFPAGNVQFIGVDDFKKSPVGEYEQLGILRVPTFIIYKNNIESGRIIENPTTSLEQDILNILVGN